MVPRCWRTPERPCWTRRQRAPLGAWRGFERCSPEGARLPWWAQCLLKDASAIHPEGDNTMPNETGNSTKPTNSTTAVVTAQAGFDLTRLQAEAKQKNEVAERAKKDATDAVEQLRRAKIELEIRDALWEAAQLESEIAAAWREKLQRDETAKKPREEAEKKLVEAREKFKAAQKTFSEEEVEKLKGKVKQADAVLVEKKGELASAEAEVTRLEKELKAAQEKVVRAKAASEAAQTAKAAAEKEETAALAAKAKEQEMTFADRKAEGEALHALREAEAELEKAKARYEVDQWEAQSAYLQTEAELRKKQLDFYTTATKKADSLGGSNPSSGKTN